MLFFAHHVEMHDMPVLGAFFLLGIWTGWDLLGRLTRRTSNRP